MSMERAYFERMAQAYSAPDQDQYLRHVAKADALLRQHGERSRSRDHSILEEPRICRTME